MALCPAGVTAAGEVRERAGSIFVQAFGQAPATTAVAPGRMNLMGDHTDYNQGFVLPAAIDRQVAVAVRPRSDQRVVVRSDRYPMAVDLPAVPAKRQEIWADYVLGVADELRRSAGIDAGFQAAIASEIPVGSGLSSSGALEVAVAVALLEAHDRMLPPRDIAQLCQRAENSYVGARTGIMDQFAALLGRADYALLLDCRSLEHHEVPLPGGDLVWLLADTQVHHALASSAYNQRRAECEAAAQALGIASLRDAGEDDLDRIPDPVQRKRARHVVTENARVQHVAAALRRGTPLELGPDLFASHVSLRDDFEVSCAELDALVDLAAAHEQVVGARMMGGGFGGCVLILLHAGGLDGLEQHLAQGYRQRFSRLPAFYRVRSVDGAVVEARA